MNIILERSDVTDHGIDGRIYINNEYVCDTTENPMHHLPVGEYDVILKKSNVYGRRMPILKPTGGNPPSAKGKKQGVIAYGNGLAGIKDCRIHVGKFRVSGLVINSFNTFKTLYNRINISRRRGNEVTLTIKE